MDRLEAVYRRPSRQLLKDVRRSQSYPRKVTFYFFFAFLLNVRQLQKRCYWFAVVRTGESVLPVGTKNL